MDNSAHRRPGFRSSIASRRRHTCGRARSITHGAVPRPDASEAQAQFDEDGVIGKVLLVVDPAAD